MRPKSFAIPTVPDVAKASSAGACEFGYRLVCACGGELVASVVVSKTARDYATQLPFETDPMVVGAIETQGRAVIGSLVLQRDDPTLNWIVYAEGVVLVVVAAG